MEFIPLNLGGVYRPLRFANGLKEAGINPIIITFEVDDNLKKIQNKFDFKLFDKLRKDITVYRIPLEDVTQFYKNKFTRFKNIYFNVTDNYLKAWRKNFYKQIPALANEREFFAFSDKFIRESKLSCLRNRLKFMLFLEQ